MTKLLDPRDADTLLLAGEGGAATVLLDANADGIDADDFAFDDPAPPLAPVAWEEDEDENDDLLGLDDDEDYDEDYDDDDFFDDEEDDDEEEYEEEGEYENEEEEEKADSDK